MTQPAAIPADGNLKVVYVATIAIPSVPTQAECRAAGIIDLSCYLTGDGFNPSTDEQVVTDERLCSVQTFEEPGRYTDRLDIIYVYQGQALTAADNKAFATLARLTGGYLVCRWGASYSTDLTAANIVDVIPVKAGIQVKGKPEANGKLKIMQRMFITNTVQRNVAIVA